MRSGLLATPLAFLAALLLLDTTAAVAASRIDQAVYAELSASDNGRAYVVIATTPAVSKAGEGLAAVQAQNQATQDRILSSLDPGDFEPVYQWENVSGMTGYVTFSGLQKLASHPDIVAVGPDERGHAVLDSSVPYIHADNVHNAGITGQGITVAVLDTGIDTDHPDLSDNIAAGAWTFLNQGATSMAGAEDDEGHGTNVSGIITSKGLVSSPGVAPDADILAIKVLDSSGSGWLSDWISGVNYVVGNAGNYTNLCAMNMSLGSNTLYPQCPCDNANATNIALKNALDNAINAGIASFASSGNDASTTSMGSPACISGATAVAAVYETDLGREPNSGTYASGCFDGTTTSTQITCFSNRSSCNELAAPGRNIVAPGLGGGISNFTGTSQAAPHATGVAALMCQVADSLGNNMTPAQMVQTMKSTGSATFDPAGTSPNPILINALGAVLGGTPAAVTLSAAVPNTASMGNTVDVVLLGSNLSAFFEADFGADVTVNTLSAAPSGDSLFVNITVDDFGTAGSRDIIVTDSFSADTLGNGFTLLETTRHYVSPAGDHTWPYITPSTAAATLADAIAAATHGDSILVDSTTVTVSSLSLSKGVILYGGWTDAFANRDAENTRTTLNLSFNVSILASGHVAGLDGFRIQDGAGTLESLPINGNYGGGIKVLQGTAHIANNEIRNCDANTGIGFGGGGAIYAASGAVANITNNWIHSNTATRGGAIYLYDSDGSTITGNTIENNTVAVAGLDNPYGAGIVLQQCSNTVVADNVLQGNSGANDGGAAWLNNSTNTQWSGGTITQHAASNAGGALYLTSSDATLDSVWITHNSSSLFGGALWTDSDLSLNQCVLKNNAGVLGGGLYATGTTTSLTHNLWVLNSAASIGGAIYLSGATNGDVIGNTLDRNSAGSGAGGVLLTSGTYAVHNNIVTNTTGSGIGCSGSTVTLSHNLVWNSSGSDYDGCSPGTGAVSDDPVFADTMNVDYHLGLHSPAIDAADPDPTWNDPDGSRGDLGWFGSHPSTMQQPEYPKNLMAAANGGNIALSWDPNPEVDIDVYAVYCDSVSGFIPSLMTFVGSTADSTFDAGPIPADTLYYRVAAVNTSGYSSGWSLEVASDPTPTDTQLAPPSRTALQQNFPNPFNPMTTIRFDLARPGSVRLSVYDMAGRLVRVLLDTTLPADRHRVVWDGRDRNGVRVSSGIYHSRLETADGTFHRKMVLLK